MENFFKKISTLMFVLILFLSSGLVTGCSFLDVNFDVDDGYDNENEITKLDYTFNVSSSLTKTSLNISGVGEYGDYARVVSLKPWEYLYGEEQVGISDYIQATPVDVAEYECGTTATIEVDRYVNKFDTIYNKYYVLDYFDNILAGPVYATEIEPEYKHKQVLTAKGIKGVMCDDAYQPEVADLGCEHTELNFLYTGMIVPNEIYNKQTGEITPIKYIENVDSLGNVISITRGGETTPVEAYDYNGTRYYFRTETYGGYQNLHHYDNLISKYTNDGVKVTLIMLTGYNSNQYIQPHFLTYEASHSQSQGTLRAVNASNPYGAGYWGAFMEFISKRYSCEDGSSIHKYGTVESYVLGNEIDLSVQWNVMVDVTHHEALSIADYATEYERMMRIANQAMKKYYTNNVALVSITNRWYQLEGFGYYAPKNIIDFLCNKTRLEGNYNWGIAAHPYGVNLSQPEFWKNDTKTLGMNGSLNTSNISWTNLEVLQLYLEQDSKKCNGNIRDVYITEGGVSSSDTSNTTMFSTTKNQQAAGIAYIYYKCSQLSCIKALNYYRLIDNSGESAYFGLLSPNKALEKPAYKVYKYVDTQYSFIVSNDYLSYIEWSKFIDGSYYSYGKNVGNVNDYQDTMALFDSRFDWDSNWNLDLMIIREVASVPEYDAMM